MAKSLLDFHAPKGAPASSGKLRLSGPCFFIYLAYFSFILAAVFLDFLCKAFDLPQGSAVSRLAAAAFLLPALLLSRNFFLREKQTTSKLQTLTGVAVISLVSLLKIVYPDTNFDTLHYHLIAQRQGFTDYFAESQGFARGNFQVWGFPLGDKAFWYFRSLLGYRLATVLNSFALFIVYAQLLKIFDALFPDKRQISSRPAALERAAKTLFALSAVTSHYIVLNIGTYMVDALALPFILECLFLLLTADGATSRRTAFYFAFLCGICVALKLTNTVFALPLASAYILKTRKFLATKTIIACVLLAAAPSLPFIVYNRHITGNPIFPYYNSIFRSDYYPLSNFKDRRFGPENTIQAVAWIWNFIFFPNVRMSEIPSKWNFLYALGLLGEAAWLAKFARKPEGEGRLENLDYLAFATIASTLLWSFTTGYARYFQGGMVLMAIFAYYFLERVLSACKKFMRRSLLKGFKTLSLVVLVLQSAATAKSFEDGREWSWREFSCASFKQNFRQLLKDNRGGVYQPRADPRRSTDLLHHRLHVLRGGRLCLPQGKDSEHSIYQRIRPRCVRPAGLSGQCHL